ncbi:hypothetical protein Areg01_58990 [Actinoplanes regularis]|nr:hypothetical protein Areg01_58990 [Actinoplanes regularis]
MLFVSPLFVPVFVLMMVVSVDPFRPGDFFAGLAGTVLFGGGFYVVLLERPQTWPGRSSGGRTGG